MLMVMSDTTNSNIPGTDVATSIPVEDVFNVDAMVSAVREKAKRTYTFTYLDREWTARYSVPFGVLAAQGDDLGVSDVVTVLSAYIVKEQREDFKAALLENDDISIEELGELSNFLNEKASGNATPAS
jgi:hypothetical protein